MTQAADIQKAKLKVGDEIGTTVLVSDVDKEDFTVWMRVREVLTTDNGIAYRVTFPDGSIRRTLIPELCVQHSRRSFPTGNCQCGRVITSNEFCECGVRLFPF